MEFASRPSPTPDAIVRAANATGLSLDHARAETVQPWLEIIYSSLDSLKAVDLGETPPSFAFKSRKSDRAS